MSEETKKLRKVSRCVQTMLELDGVETTSKRVEEIIKDQTLEDPFKLKKLVAERLQAQGPDKAKGSPTTRREVLQSFIAAHWDEIKTNELVKSALLNAYCMGRHKKDKRNEMVAELVALCEGGTVVAAVPAPAITSQVVEEVTEDEKEPQAMPNSKDYQF